MAPPKKRKSAEFRKRSKAAKKGWATRRAKAAKVTAKVQRKKLQNAQLAKPKRKRRVIPRLDLKGKTQEELEAIIRKQEEQIRIHERTKDWVHAMPDEYLHPDGTIALFPSRLRHMGEATEEIIRILSNAKDQGEFEFDYMVNLIAAELDCPVREVYTLYYSP